MDFIDALLTEAESVRKECFPGSEETTVGEAISFMLGVPVDDAAKVIEVAEHVARSRVDEDDPDHEEDLLTMVLLVGIELGVAAQRINHVSV